MGAERKEYQNIGTWQLSTTHSSAPPPAIKSPPYSKVVTVGDWQEALREISFSGDVDDPDGNTLCFQQR